MKTTKPKPTHYVDNKRFFDALLEYKQAKLNAPENDPPQIPEYIGECLLAIAKKYSNRGSFASYTYRDDMVSDAIENCILYLHNFNPEKSKNPFAYFTQIMHWAFIRRIEREKKQTYTKYKYAINKSILKEDYDIIGGEDNDLKSPNWMSYSNVDALIKDYEDKLEKKNKKHREYKKRYVDDLVGDDDINEPEEEENPFITGFDMNSILDPIEFDEEIDEDDEDDVPHKEKPKKNKKDEDSSESFETPESLILNGEE